MKYFNITIYSPADEQEHVNTMTVDPNQQMAVIKLLMDTMEPGAWFKIERVS
jgi:succinate dehydrogenase/fumarate reductase-like Fe-S protein